jgi:exosortase/archaeosortase family protein
MADAPPRGPTAARAYVGLAVLGGGLSILVGAAPHEDPLVGLALAAFGATLVATAPRLPAIARLPPAAVATAGTALVLAIAANAAWRHDALDLPKAAILALGLALAACAPLLARGATLPLGRRRVPLATLVASLLPALGAPLLAWGVQALFKGSFGTTPIELFVRVALLVPLAAFLRVLGLAPHVQGQTIEYLTPRGPLSLEVGAACSGVQAMALFAGVLALFLAAERPGGRRLAIWSCIGLLGVYAANLLRLAVLTLVGYAWGPDALLRVHAEAGWMFFVAWAMLFAWLARRSGTARPAP